jgi:cbb3-type cytochrome oxidase subunit 1
LDAGERGWVYTLVRRFIKTGVGFLALGLAIGLYMLVQREVFGIWPHPLVRSAHVHAVFGGFVMFLILGVALWLFPRADKADRRYRPGRIRAAYWILAVTTFIRVAGEMARAWEAGAGLRWLVVAAGVGQVAGFALYFYTMWGRIRPVGSHLREAKGERF